MPLNSKLSLSRRHFFMGVAASGFMASTAGAGVYFNRQGSAPDFASPAYSLWSQTSQGSYSDFEYMALCAHLAASPHNTQPWTFSFAENQITLVADTARNLGMADPDRRQMHQGIGCAVENLTVAAEYLGYDTEVILPEGEAEIDADIKVVINLVPRNDPTPSHAASAAFNAIFKRTTNRAKYDTAVDVPNALLDQITSETPKGVISAFTRQGTEDAAYITAALRRSARSLVHDDAFYKDSMNWWRRDRAALEAHGDGISILSTDMGPTVKGGMATLVSDGMWIGEFGRRGEIGGVDGAVLATPVWGIIANRDGSLKGRIEAGRLLEKVYLRAAEAGLHVHPLNYPVEHPGLARQIQYRFGFEESAEVLTIFRLGKGPETEKSPRRPLNSVIA